MQESTTDQPFSVSPLRHLRLGALVIITALLWLMSGLWSAASAQEPPTSQEAGVSWGCNGNSGYVIFTVTNPTGNAKSYELMLIDDDSGEQIVQTPVRNVNVSPFNTEAVLIEGLYNYAELKPRVLTDGQPLENDAVPNEINLYCRPDTFSARAQCTPAGLGELFTFSATGLDFEVIVEGVATIELPPMPPGENTTLATALADGIYRVRATSGGQEIYIGDVVVECDFEAVVRPVCINLQRYVEVSLTSEFFAGGTSVSLVLNGPELIEQSRFIRMDPGVTSSVRLSNQAADAADISVLVNGRPVPIDTTLDFACESVVEPTVEIDHVCAEYPGGITPAFDIYVESTEAGIFGVALRDDLVGLIQTASIVTTSDGQPPLRLGFTNQGEPALIDTAEYQIAWTWNGVSGGAISTEATDCEGPPVGEPPSAEVQVSAECLLVRGRVDVFITNTSGPVSEFVARLNIAGLPPRSIQLSPDGPPGTLTWTGRNDNTYVVTVERDGVLIFTDEVQVDCTPPPADEVTVTQSCLGGRGRFDVVLFNSEDLQGPNNGVRDYVVTVGRIVRERTITATEGPVNIIVTGRPPGGTIEVTVERTDIGVIYAEDFAVDC